MVIHYFQNIFIIFKTKSLKNIADGGNLSPEKVKDENKFPVHLEPHSYKVFKLK